MCKTFLAIIILAVGILNYSGCSSTSNSLRYKSTKKNEKENSVRYSNSENSELNSTDTLNTSSEENEEEFEGFTGEKVKVDISQVVKKYGSQSPLNADKSTSKEKVLMEIIRYLNTPYKFGGNSKDGIDCSAFTQTVFNNALEISLQRTARDQFIQGEGVEELKDLQFGDLVFFNTRKRVKPGHVGIYLGENLFAHASRTFGVTISSLDEEYYFNRFMGGRRIENYSSTN